MNDDERKLGEVLRRELRDIGAQIEPSPQFMRRLEEIPNRPLRWPSRSWLLAPAGAVAAAIVIVLVLVALGSTPSPALAFSVAGGKTVRVTVQEIEAVAPANTRLAELGRVQAVAMTPTCRTPASEVSYMMVSEHPTPRISLGNPQAGYSGTEIIAARQSAANRIILAIGTVTGKVPSCVTTKGSGPGMPGWHLPSRDRLPSQGASAHSG